MDRRVSAPLVTRDALEAFTQRLAGQFAPEQFILFGSMARGGGGALGFRRRPAGGDAL